MTRLIGAVLAALAVVALARCESRSKPTAPGLVVFAAASTTEVITEAAARFEKARGLHVTTSFDSSSTLAKQIKAGARADVFLSADERWMDDLTAAGAIQAATRADLLGNALVLIAPKGKGFAATFSKDFDFAARLPHVKRIAVGDPTHVPAGLYAKQALESLGWWAGANGRLIPAQDVRAALRLVELGEADAGIVYSTDARVSPKVEVAGEFPESSHEPIRYPVAACAKAGASATAFIEFLRSPEMAAIFEARGFRVVR
jgi:molybdate transport system substrate-binding protein